MQTKDVLGFDDAVAFAKGCFAYGGGYRADEEKLRVFHHGIQTVINSLEAAQRGGLSELQTRMLHYIGGGPEQHIIRASAPQRNNPGEHVSRKPAELWLVEGGKAYRLSHCKTAPAVPLEWLEVEK